jgi:hypothetical protein
MPRADQRLRYASSPISASVSPATEEKTAFGAEICQGCPRTLLSTISPTVHRLVRLVPCIDERPDLGGHHFGTGGEPVSHELSV